MIQDFLTKNKRYKRALSPQLRRSRLKDKESEMRTEGYDDDADGNALVERHLRGQITRLENQLRDKRRCLAKILRSNPTIHPGLKLVWDKKKWDSRRTRRNDGPCAA
jgi:hypothetical protein